MGGGEGKAWGIKKFVLSRSQPGKNSGYIRWQAARAVKVVDGGRERGEQTNEQRAKLLLLFIWFRLCLSLTNNSRPPEEHQPPEITRTTLAPPMMEKTP